MKLLVVALFVAAASAGRLENTYLPPSSAGGAGGNGGFLGAPSRGAPAKLTSGFGASGAYRAAGSGGYSGAGGAGGYQGGRSAAQQVGIVRYDNNNDGLGSYSYAYETENHITAQETGELKNAGSENEATSVQGSYSYTGPDGVAITVHYVADENGFQPSGDHLPTPPPIPEAILKSLQYNAANPSPDSGDNGGQYQQPSFGRQYLAPNKPGFSPQSGYRY